MHSQNKPESDSSVHADDQPPAEYHAPTEHAGEQSGDQRFESRTELDSLEERAVTQRQRRVPRHDPAAEDWEIMRRMLTLNKTLTSPGRLAVLAALWRAGDLDYVYLQNLAGTSQGNLASHCRKLEEAELIESRKSFIHRRANTRLFITDAGRDAISGYVEGLRSLMERVENWQPAVDDYRGFYETDQVRSE